MNKVLVKRENQNTPSSSAFSTLQCRQIPASHTGKKPPASDTNIILSAWYNEKTRLH